MKLKLSLLTFCCFFTIKLLAQTPYTVKGKIADTAAKSNLLNTSISVLNAKDSILRAFTRAGADGSFAVNNLGKGKFILLVTYPGYADYVEQFALDSAHSAHDFGRVKYDP